MGRITTARRRVIQLAAAATRQRNQCLHRMYGQRGMHGDAIVSDGQQTDRCKIACQIVIQFAIQPGVDGLRRGRHEQCVTIGGGTRRQLGAEIAAGAGAIINHHLLADLFG